MGKPWHKLYCFCRRRAAEFWPFIILFILLAVGSLWDYPISLRLYDQNNPFGLFFAAFGEYPSALGFCAAGTLFFKSGRRRPSLSGGLQITAGVCLIVLGTCLTSALPARYLPIPAFFSYLIGIVVSASTICRFAQLCRSADHSAVLRLALAILSMLLLDYLIVNALKLLWGRPRMRLVASDSRVPFMPWWNPDPSLRDPFVVCGTALDEFKSFPSGHTANASALMLLSLLPQLHPSLASRRHLLFTAGFSWTALVALSRIVTGAHYLTDTVMGFTIGLAVLSLVTLLFFPETPVTKLWTPPSKCVMLKKAN